MSNTISLSQLQEMVSAPCTNCGTVLEVYNGVNLAEKKVQHLSTHSFASVLSKLGFSPKIGDVITYSWWNDTIFGKEGWVTTISKIVA